MEMFDQMITTHTEANGKPVSEFEDACAKFKKAHRRFEQWDQESKKHPDKWTRIEYWAALNNLSEAEQRVEQIFMGVAEPTQKCRMQYALFRELFLENKPMTPNC